MKCTANPKRRFRQWANENFENPYIQEDSWYIFVQVGEFLGWKMHYEFQSHHVWLHIEDEIKGRGIVSFLRRKLCHDRRITNICNSFVLNEPPKTLDELEGCLNLIKDKTLPLITEYEKQIQSFCTDVNRWISSNSLDLPLDSDVSLLSNQTLFDVLTLPKMRIPDYQRIYCWEKGNVTRLWNDIENLDECHDHHLGSVILHKDDKGYLNIVDGQQRLITLAIILKELGDMSLPFLGNTTIDSEESLRYVEHNMSIVRGLITNRVSSDTNLHIANKMRNHLRLSILILNGTSLDIAYTFFSNQNSKGLVLNDYELLKAHHLRFMFNEAEAIYDANRWDNRLKGQSEEKELDIERTLGRHIYRLRKWMRKQYWNDDKPHRVRDEYVKARTIKSLPPFGEQFIFYEKIQGGSHFFAFADYFVRKYNDFCMIDIVAELNKKLMGEHANYFDIIETLLFGYYLKFGTLYIEDAFVCISEIISRHRYEKRQSYYNSILEYANNTELIMILNESTSPTFFIAEALDVIKAKKPIFHYEGIQQRYYEQIHEVYSTINEKRYVSEEIMIIANS